MDKCELNAAAQTGEPAGAEWLIPAARFKGKRDFPKKMPVAVELVTQENVNDYTGYGKKQ